MRNKIIIFLIFFALFYLIQYLSKKNVLPQAPQPKTAVVSVTPLSNAGFSTSSAVLGSSVCHDIHINASDPQAFLPDPSCTPGATNPAVTQDTIRSTICKSGYTTTIRPPVSYTNKLKAEQIAAYGYTDTSLHDYEEDHFIPLEVGGSASDPKNLWPEPHASINEKDKVENFLNRQVCTGALSLHDAQSEIVKNWYQVYTENGL